MYSRSTSDNVPAAVIGPLSLGDWTDLEDLDQLWTPQRAELHDMVAIHSLTSALQRSSIAAGTPLLQSIFHSFSPNARSHVAGVDKVKTEALKKRSKYVYRVPPTPPPHSPGAICNGFGYSPHLF